MTTLLSPPRPAPSPRLLPMSQNHNNSSTVVVVVVVAGGRLQDASFSVAYAAQLARGFKKYILSRYRGASESGQPVKCAVRRVRTSAGKAGGRAGGRDGRPTGGSLHR